MHASVYPYLIIIILNKPQSSEAKIHEELFPQCLHPCKLTAHKALERAPGTVVWLKEEIKQVNIRMYVIYAGLLQLSCTYWFVGFISSYV